MRRLLSLASALWLFSAGLPAAQASGGLRGFVHRAWTAREGGPAGAVLAIAQSADGYLWLASEAEGLVRFDGVRFEPVPELAQLHDAGETRVLCLLAGTDGTLWVGTNWGLARLLDGRWELVAAGREISEVWGIAEAPDGGIWLALLMRGIGTFKDGSLRISEWKTGRPQTVAVDRQHQVWIGGSEGLSRLEGGPLAMARPGGPGNSFVGRNGLATAAAGGLWAATRGGLMRVEAGQQQGRLETGPGLGREPCNVVLEDGAGRLWVGTVSGGLRQRSKGGTRFATFSLRDGLTSDEVLALFEDREGSLWVGTSRGLDQLRPSAFETIGEPEGLAGDKATAIIESFDGTVWVWSDGGGLSHLVGGRIDVYNHEQGLASDFGGPLFESRDHSLFIGHDRGLTRFRQGKATVYREGLLSQRYVSAITEDEEGLLISVLDAGFFRFDDGELRPFVDAAGWSQDRRMVSMALPARDGTLWLATVRGLKAIPRNGRMRVVWELPEAAVTLSVFEDEAGTIWVGSQHGALRVAGDQVSRFTVADGLPHDHINSILVDRLGYVWMSCPRGIFRVARAELEALAAGRERPIHGELFGIEHGLRSAEGTGHAQPAGCLTRDGRIWFTTGAGVVVVDPTDLRRNKVPPPVVIEALRAGGREVPLGGEPRVPAGSEQLEIQYTGLSLRAPERVRFEYQLQGFDAGFVDAGTRRTAFYTRVPPGAYTFRVRAANEDGVWSERDAALSFELAPLWYQRSSVRLLGLFAVAVLLSLAYRSRVRSLERREGELAHRVRERTTALEKEVAEHERTASRLREEVEERQRAEVELRGYRDDLERQVVARTAELEGVNRQLRDEIAERRGAEAHRERLIGELETKNAELERFTYTVSHDLKSPLITIRGFIGLLQAQLREVAPERVGRDLGRIAGAADRMQRLLDELLEISRVGRLVNPSEDVAFAELASEAVRLVSGQLSKAGLSLEIGQDLPIVHVDRPRVVEALQNLIDNAVKFMGDEPAPRVEIGAEARATEVVLYVRDNGIGIEPRFHDRVFRIFERLDTSIEGTGIGLALVKRIVEHHGGRIWIESEGKGTGTRICFTLPGAVGEKG